MVAICVLLVWAILLGLVTILHKRVYGFHWWNDESAAVAMGFMGLLTLLMFAGLIVYVYMRAMGLVTHA